MSDSISPVTPDSTRRFGLDALLTGASLAASVVFGMMWWQARQEVGDLERRIEPLRQEAERYRDGLREEVVRTHQLSEDLKAARTKSVSIR